MRETSQTIAAPTGDSAPATKGVVPVLASIKKLAEFQVSMVGQRPRLLRPGLLRNAVRDIDGSTPQMRWTAKPNGGDGLWLRDDGRSIDKRRTLGANLLPPASLTCTDAANALSASMNAIGNLVRGQGLPIIGLSAHVLRVASMATSIWLRTGRFQPGRCPKTSPKGRALLSGVAACSPHVPASAWTLARDGWAAALLRHQRQLRSQASSLPQEPFRTETSEKGVQNEHRFESSK